MLDLMQYRDIYRQTIARWGEDAQHDQAIEECAELITVLKHYRRDRVDADAVVDELADVFLMLGQLIFMFGEQATQDAIVEKIAKLNRLLAT
ncbi:MAG: antitoxin [Desulfuromonadales bacterium]|nr:antitoxin [Desulfuromonadales bacterium]